MNCYDMFNKSYFSFITLFQHTQTVAYETYKCIPLLLILRISVSILFTEMMKQQLGRII